jgi:hypothetical protein
VLANGWWPLRSGLPRRERLGDERVCIWRELCHGANDVVFVYEIWS